MRTTTKRRRRTTRAKMTHKARPAECRDCDIPMVKGNAKTVPEGMAKHSSHGFCERCYYRRRRDGNRWDGPPPTNFVIRWKAADLAAEWEFLRRNRGCDRDEAAKILGVKRGSLDTAIARARKYAEQDRARAKLAAELAVAEAEAHRINDSMTTREDVAA